MGSIGNRQTVTIIIDLYLIFNPLFCRANSLHTLHTNEQVWYSVVAMPSDKVLQFERQVAQLLLTKLEHLQITQDRAAEISHYILTTFPEDLSDKAFQIQYQHLENKFTELSPLFHQLVANRDKAKTQQLLSNIQSSLKNT